MGNFLVVPLLRSASDTTSIDSVSRKTQVVVDEYQAFLINSNMSKCYKMCTAAYYKLLCVNWDKMELVPVLLGCLDA